MKKQHNSARASAFQIVLSIALLCISGLMALAAPNNAKKTPRQMTGVGPSSGITAVATLKAASPTVTPSPCNKIAFTSDQEGNAEIYVMNADGSNQTRLTDPSAQNLEPSFSGDGSKIAFTSDRDGFYQIYVMNADGSNQNPAHKQLGS